MKNITRVLSAVLVVLVVTLSLTAAATPATAAEIPRTTVEDLKPGSTHDWEKVVFTGYVREANILTGRRSSLYLHLIIADGDHLIHVYYYPVPITGDIVGQKVTVMGTYKPRGMIAGTLPITLDFVVGLDLIRHWNR